MSDEAIATCLTRSLSQFKAGTRQAEGGEEMKGGGGEEIKRVKEIKGEGRKAQRGEKESQSGE